jgi:hypothetical protein
MNAYICFKPKKKKKIISYPHRFKLLLLSSYLNGFGGDLNYFAKLLIYLEIQQHFLCVQNLEISITLLDPTMDAKRCTFSFGANNVPGKFISLHDEVKLSTVVRRSIPSFSGRIVHDITTLS